MKLHGKTSARTGAALHGQLKLAQLSSMSEAEFAKTQEELESSRVFLLLKAAGVIHSSEFPHARFAAKQFAGYGVRLSVASGVPALIDGNGEVVGLIQRIGQEKFEACFLKGETSDVAAAEECDITLGQTQQLRDFVNKVYIQAEFEHPGTEPAVPAQAYSAVAGISVENGRPVLSFFHREIWKGQYAVNQQKLAEYLNAISDDDKKKAESLVGKLEFLERRKTTLYRLLELLLGKQAVYLMSGEPKDRKPLTQRELARDIGVDASVLNRLVSNKSVQLPWGLEAPLMTLIPSAKDIAKELLCGLMETNPGLTDDRLRQLLEEKHAVTISRRSVAQYRKELEQ